MDRLRGPQSRWSTISRHEGLLEKIQDHKLMVPRGDRSSSVIEPFLTDQWYVQSPAAGRAGHRGGGNRRYPLRAGQLEEHLFRVDAQHPGLVHLAPDLVGPPHPRLVRPTRATSTSAAPKPRCASAHALPERFDAEAGRGRARHLVQLRPVALLDPRLAGADRAL